MVCPNARLARPVKARAATVLLKPSSKGIGMDERLIKLEEKVAFLEETVLRMEETVQELNVVVLTLRQDLVNLRRQASHVEGIPQREEPPPPHY